MSSSYRMLLAWCSAVLFWRLEDIEGITAILACIESLLKLFLSLRLLHLKGQGVHSIFFFHLMQCHFSTSGTVGVARQLRRTSTWSHRTRKSTSRSWRRTTTALEKAWGLCLRGRFLSSINPSSGLGWRTGKQTHQYCLDKRHWSEKKKHISMIFSSLCTIAETKGKWEQMELSRDPLTLSASPLQILIAEPEAQYTDQIECWTIAMTNMH